MDFHNYFIGLEDRFIEISKYVEVDSRNYSTFSPEIAIVYLAACSEFEVVSKEIGRIVDPTFSIPDINGIYSFFSQKISDILTEKVNLKRHNLTITPFDNWSQNSKLDWWASYNQVKHYRTTQYQLANLSNLIKAMCALQAVNYYLIWKRDCPAKSRSAPPTYMNMYPKVFTMSGINYDGPTPSDVTFEFV